MTKGIQLEYDNDIAKITVQNEGQQNSLDVELLEELSSAIRDAEGAHVLTVTGAGDDAFIAGADISYMADLDSSEAYEMATAGHEVCDLLERFQAPVIATINGHAYGGGCEIALACDLRVASDQAIIGQPEVGLGIIPGWGGTQRLSRIVGDEQARRMVFFAKRLAADEALEIGLVGEVTPHDELYEHVASLAQELTDYPKRSLAAAKEALNQVHEMPLQAGLTYEKRSWASLFGEHEQREGMQAFVEKRDPDF